MISFAEDVREGLTKTEKTLPSKYFYDKIGDDLFCQIMDLDEYYLTRAEYEIMTTQTDEIIEALDIKPGEFVELVELGAGDGSKTKELLKALLNKGYEFDYCPIDISQNALDGLYDTLKSEIPTLNVHPYCGEYFKVLHHIQQKHHKMVVLFLGSNLGNMEDDQAKKFIHSLSDCLNENDDLFIGLDIIKDENIILPAYSDSKGITKKFNLNLLRRINTELGANFDLNQFEHKATYKKEEGMVRSFLVSTSDQDVDIRFLNLKIHFEKEEVIHTEVSRKYNNIIVEEIFEDSGLEHKATLYDRKMFFHDLIFQKRAR